MVWEGGACALGMPLPGPATSLGPTMPAQACPGRAWRGGERAARAPGVCPRGFLVTPSRAGGSERCESGGRAPPFPLPLSLPLTSAAPSDLASCWASMTPLMARSVNRSKTAATWRARRPGAEERAPPGRAPLDAVLPRDPPAVPGRGADTRPVRRFRGRADIGAARRAVVVVAEARAAPGWGMVDRICVLSARARVCVSRLCARVDCARAMRGSRQGGRRGSRGRAWLLRAGARGRGFFGVCVGGERGGAGFEGMTV